MLALLSAAELLGMSPWFAASAVAPELTRMWSLSPSEAGWLTSAVQLGFVAGTLTAAILNLADVWSSRWYFAGSAVLAATANALLPAAGDFAAALPLRFLTGFFLAGVYPPAMKMAATWFRSGRGLAIGAIVGALTVGKASPYLVEAVGGASLGQAVGSTSAAAVAAAILIAVAYRDGPHAFPQRPFSWRLAGTVARVRELRLVTGGYLGHMWELYAYWTWLAAFLTASDGPNRAWVSP
jgi:MFS family permease